MVGAGVVREVVREELDYEVVEVAGYYGAALFAAEGAVDALVAVGVVEEEGGGAVHLEGQAGGGGMGEVGFELCPHAVEGGGEQGFFIAVVDVEGGAADIGAVEDVLHRHVFVALVQDEGDEGFVQGFSRAAHPAVRLGHGCLLDFPDNHSADVR